MCLLWQRPLRHAWRLAGLAERRSLPVTCLHAPVTQHEQGGELSRRGPKSMSIISPVVVLRRFAQKLELCREIKLDE